jgi:hypothetical protein
MAVVLPTSGGALGAFVSLVVLLLAAHSARATFIDNLVPRRDMTGAIMDSHDFSIHKYPGTTGYTMVSIGYGECVEPTGLDAVDDDERGVALLLEAGGDVAQRGGGGEGERGLLEAEAGRAQPHLLHRFLAADVEGAAAGGGNAGGGLQQYGRFADAGVAADQHGRGRHQAAAEHAVELRQAGRDARRRRRAALQPHELDAAATGGLGGDTRAARGGRGFLLQRVPGAAGIALALPLRRGGAAFLADILRAILGQAAPP